MTAQPEQTTTANEMDEIRELTSVVDGLISMMASGNIGSLKLEYGSLKLSLQSNQRTPKRTAPAPSSELVLDTPPPGEPVADIPAGHVVAAPMIGTFYVAPAPNEPPFVNVGQEVREGQTIGIVEAMKIMNEIAADKSGTIVEIMASDGQTVEYGSPLVRIEPAAE